MLWGLKGDKDPDGTPREPRAGLFTWLVVKDGRNWLIRAAQNTNLSNLPPPAAAKREHPIQPRSWPESKPVASRAVRLFPTPEFDVVGQGRNEVRNLYTYFRTALAAP